MALFDEGLKRFSDPKQYTHEASAKTGLAYLDYVRSGGGGGTDAWDKAISALGDILATYAAGASGSAGVDRELLLKQLGLDERKVAVLEREMALTERLDPRRLALEEELGRGQLNLARRAQEFEEWDTRTQRLLEAAGLATGPAGAIQLAYMARGQGAPNEQVRQLFQNLPFVQAALSGQTLPGFGVPEQLGGGGRTKGQKGGQTIKGQTFGTVLPSKTGLTEQQFTGMSDFEKLFLSQLFQAETGESAQGFLEGVMKSFIPTTKGGAIGVL